MPNKNRNIALHDAELNIKMHKFKMGGYKRSDIYPNLALMKISAYHKNIGDNVEFFKPILKHKYDIVYSSSVFSWTAKNIYLPSQKTIFGGTGYKIYDKNLDEEIDNLCPDYSLYDCNISYGFLTRGCPNKCKWCVVPIKEGSIRAYQDIEVFLRHDKCALMDNNVLASEFGIKQIEKIAKLKIKIDFNQGLDARLIDKSVAELLSKVKWLHPVRLACDTLSQMKHIEIAVKKLREANVTPKSYFVYVLVKEDVEDAVERVEFLRKLKCDPYAQAYRDVNDDVKTTQKQRDFARYVNHKAIFKSIDFNNYKGRGKKIGAKEQKRFCEYVNHKPLFKSMTWDEYKKNYKRKK